MMRLKITSALAAATMASLIGFGFVEGRAQDDTAETYRQLNLFGDVFERVRANYVEEVTDEKLIEAAINGMLQSLDPHSAYLTAKSFKEMQVQTRGEFGGLGIEVTLENGIIKVVSPLDDTPAYRAGIKPGDLITHLDGDPIMGLSLNEAVEKMRGPVGTDIKLTIRREGTEPFDLDITRDIIRIQSVRARTEGEVGYIRITTFNEQTKPGIESAMAKFEEELGGKLQGIVLDLRNNPGGLLDQAIAASDAFLDKGEIVSTRGRRPEDTQRFNADSGDLAKDLPMVVLINNGSASASEIVAGALQDHGRAIILGTRSFGKGSVQTLIPLGGHGAMRLTTSRYYTPSGNSIQAKGIEPDIVVEAAKIEKITGRRARREENLPGRLDNPGANGEATEGTEEVAPDETQAPGHDSEPPATEDDQAKDEGGGSVEDYQLSRALDLIRGIHMFKSRSIN